MSSAMRSTLQTVPESHEVTRGADSSGSAKTPVKLTSDSSKPRSTFSYHTTSSTNKELVEDDFNCEAIITMCHNKPTWMLFSNEATFCVHGSINGQSLPY